MARYLILLLLMALAGKALGQSRTLADAIEGKHFTFRAQSVTPMEGRSRNLTPDYTLRVTKDSLICYLPYIGTQYTMPTPDEMRFGGYQFAVTEYSYRATNSKHGGWDIAITTRAQRDRQNMDISCSKNGWCQLRIVSTGKDPISYYGEIIEY